MNRAEKRRQRKMAEKAVKNLKPARFTHPSPGQQGPAIKQAINLAGQYHEAGHLRKAEKIYQQILQADPNQPIALHLLGVLSHQFGKYDNAVDLIRRALTIKPDYADAHYNLGCVLKEQGKPDEAVASYQEVLTIEPNSADGHNNLGVVLQDLGRLDEAVASFNKALTIAPKSVDGHNNLGVVLQDLGRLDEAVASYHEALTIAPDFADAHSNLGNALNELGRVDEAFTCHRRAVALNPKNELFWMGLAGILEKVAFTSVDDDLLQYLWDLSKRPAVHLSDVIRPIISAIRHHQTFSKILELTGSGKPEIEITYADAAGQLSSIPLLLRIMGLSPIYDLEIERMFTFLRRAMIQAAMAKKMNGKGLPFSAALALQCFANEYVYSETREEKTAVEDVEQHIAMLVDKEQDVPPSLVAALGAYRPLFDFPWAGKLSDRDWTGDISQVIRRQISEPLEERLWRSEMPSLTPIQDSVSQSVREQYEENPYPRWIKTGLFDNARAIGNILREAPLRFDLGDYVSPEKPEILVAGCGTGQHALVTASRFSNANVLAVDLSLSSLTYAKRKTKELGLSNIEYAQGDIMELGNLGRQFDLIESAGVLHHLADPLAGWRILVDLLRPGGLMKIGLYSEIARRHIVSGRSLIAEMGYTTSPEDIRRCRLEIIARAEKGNQEMAKICRGMDFFSLSDCRDFLFHVQEIHFNFPQIGEALEALNLKFLGFELRDQTILRKFRKSHPGRSELVSLSHWHEFERAHPETFLGMYQFWCRKM